MLGQSRQTDNVVHQMRTLQAKSFLSLIVHVDHHRADWRE